MKKLCIMRHATSTQKSPQEEDHNRTLDTEARFQCEEVGNYLRKLPFQLDIIMASDALRTKETAVRILEYLSYKPELEFYPELYRTTTEKIYRFLQNVNDAYSHLLIVAHNPIIHSLCHFLLKEAKNNDIYKKIHDSFPPAGLALFTLPYDSWEKISPGSGFLEDFMTSS